MGKNAILATDQETGRTCHKIFKKAFLLYFYTGLVLFIFKLLSLLVFFITLKPAPPGLIGNVSLAGEKVSGQMQAG